MPGMCEARPRYHRWPKRLLWEQIGRALVSCANLPVAAIFGSSLPPGWMTTADISSRSALATASSPSTNRRDSVVARSSIAPSSVSLRLGGGRRDRGEVGICCVPSLGLGEALAGLLVRDNPALETIDKPANLLFSLRQSALQRLAFPGICSGEAFSFLAIGLDVPLDGASVCQLRLERHHNALLRVGERAVPSGSSFPGTQRINGATEGDLYKKPVCTRNGYGREVVWEYSRPIIAPVNRRYRSDDAPPSFVAGKRNTSRLSILITVSRPAECACLMRRNPASVSSIISP